jgi:hypothetical protein
LDKYTQRQRFLNSPEQNLYKMTSPNNQLDDTEVKSNLDEPIDDTDNLSNDKWKMFKEEHKLDHSIKLTRINAIIQKLDNMKDRMNANRKRNLGQFYTTNYKYILSNMKIPEGTTRIIEPFAGECDLLKFLTNSYTIECYDIDVKNPAVIHRDTLNNPPTYEDKFVLTNPPYLARNKSTDKAIYDKYKQNDLYKCFISELTTNNCAGGIIIVPLNFWCSIRKNDIFLRKKFLNCYDMVN